MSRDKNNVIYKEYEIDTQGNGYGYFEAISVQDCDAAVLVAKTIEELKTDIDELNY